MASDVEKIKEILNIVDVISSYIKLEKAGVNLKARCPFHNEKTPSFFVSPERDNYYCFGCGAKGDILSFVENFEGLDFKGALEVLANRAGVVLSKTDSKNKSENDRIYSVMEEVTSFFEDNLSNSINIKKYLEKRGLNNETIILFRLGFAPEEWRLAYDFLTKKGFKDTEIEKAGLIKKNEDGRSGFYDRFRNRIIFPIFDSAGRVIAFSGRIIKEDTRVPKYLNSPETPIFNKSKTLYGIDKAKIPIRKNNFCILVEGQVDLLLAHQIGYRNTVALSGTALSVDHLSIIKKLTNNLVIAFDADGAGMQAARRGAKIALSMGIDLKIARIPGELDPADLICEDPEKWKKIIKESQHIIDFDLENILSNNYDKRKLGIKIQQELLPYVANIENNVDQSYFLKRISEKTEISEEALIRELNKVNLNKAELSINSVNNLVQTLNRKEDIEKRILGIIFWQQSFKNPEININEITEQFLKITGRKSIDLLISIEEKEKAIFQAEVFLKDSSNLKSNLTELLLNLEEEYLKEDLAKYMNQLGRIKNEDDRQDSSELLKMCQEISIKIHQIKNKRIKSI